jgi:hypothetical protein
LSGSDEELATYIGKEEFVKEAEEMFKVGVDYSDSARKPQANTLEGNCIFRLFATRYNVPVVVYVAWPKNSGWSTFIYGKDGCAVCRRILEAKDFQTHPLQLVNYYTVEKPILYPSEPSERSHTVILEAPVTRLSAETQVDIIAQAMANPLMTLVVTDCLRSNFVWNDILAELKGCPSSGRIDRFRRNDVSKHGCYLPLAWKKESRTERLAENSEQKPKPNYKNFVDCNSDYPNKLAYWMDIEMEEVTPTFYANFLKNFRLTKYLPAGEGCLHNHLGGPRERPLLGPLAFLGPSEAVTPIHEDGGGTVDSAHLNVQGYNQILIFPRTKGDLDKVARDIMGLNESMRWENRENLWPTPDMLRRLLAVRIIPVSVVLSPGELLHINKGRLHCFMKAFAPPAPPAPPASPATPASTAQPAPPAPPPGGETPCNPPETPALSIAWDWVNIGGEVECDEVRYSLARSKTNQINGVASLAWPETCLIKMLLKMELKDIPPKLLVLMKDILTTQLSWCSIVNKNLTVMGFADEDDENRADELKQYYWTLGCIPVPMADSFFCVVCSMELSNAYFQCGGCRTLLNHNFFVCGLCYQAGKHKKPRRLENSCSPTSQSSVNHIVNETSKTCADGPCVFVCTQCELCVKCKCVCHTKFFLRFRFLDKQAVGGKLDLLNKYLNTNK